MFTITGQKLGRTVVAGAAGAAMVFAGSGLASADSEAASSYPATAVGAAAASPVPPGSPGDANGNGQLDSSETPDNPDT